MMKGTVLILMDLGSVLAADKGVCIGADRNIHNGVKRQYLDDDITQLYCLLPLTLKIHQEYSLPDLNT